MKGVLDAVKGSGDPAAPSGGDGSGDLLKGVVLPAVPTKTWADVINKFKADLNGGPLGDLFNYSPPSDGGGSCPEISIALSFLNTTVSTDAHCQIWNKISPVLSDVMTWAWAAVGVLILLSS